MAATHTLFDLWRRDGYVCVEREGASRPPNWQRQGWNFYHQPKRDEKKKIELELEAVSQIGGDDDDG